MAQVPQSKSRSSARAAAATPDSHAETSPEGSDASDAPAPESASDPNAAAEPAVVSSHPHFDDGGAHPWETQFEAAVARARAERKLVFIEMGREQCSQCRALVQNVLTRPEIRELVDAHYVVLASDCDDPEDEVFDLAHKLEEAMMLPFVLIVDAQGQFIEGSSGAQDPATLKRTLERLAPERAAADASTGEGSTPEGRTPDGNTPEGGAPEGSTQDGSNSDGGTNAASE